MSSVADLRSPIVTHSFKKLFSHDQFGITSSPNTFILIFLGSSWIHWDHLIKAFSLSKFLIQFLVVLLFRPRFLLVVWRGSIRTTSTWMDSPFNLLVRISCTSSCSWSIRCFNDSILVGIMRTRRLGRKTFLKTWNNFLIICNFLLKSLNVFIVFAFQVFHFLICLFPLLMESFFILLHFLTCASQLLL